MPTAEIIPFPSKFVYSAASFEDVSKQADIALVDVFCEYADQLAVRIVAGPLHLADKMKLIRIAGIIASQQNG